jgi:hypothetical protein
MEYYLHNFKGIAKGRGLPPLNPMECGFVGRDSINKLLISQARDGHESGAIPPSVVTIYFK